MFGDRNEEDPFASIDDVDANGGRNPYLLAGQYLLECDKLKVFTSKDGILYFLAELKILGSNNPERPEGLVISYMTKMKSEMGPINIKRLIAALNGIDPASPEANAEITGDVCKLAVSAEQPLKGFQVYAQATDSTSRDKNPFLDIKWIPVAPTAPAAPA